MSVMPEPTVEAHRGVKDRGLPPKDRTIDPRQAAQAEAVRLKALAPGTYRRSDGSPPEGQDFEAFSRQYDQMANERHVWRFARPDGSTYETSWRGLSTGTRAEASASLLGHRVIGEVAPGPPVEGAPARVAGATRREQQLTPPVQAAPRITPPPLVQAEPPFDPPFDPLPWPLGPVDDDQRGIKNKLGPPKRAKRTAGGRGASLSTGRWTARLRDPDYDYIFAADPKRSGIFADPSLSVDERENRLALAEPAFAIWLKTVLQPTVSNFIINLKLELNNESQLRDVGVIFPGQSDVDRRNTLENGSQRNAFRHTFGQALIARKAGRELAVISGHAHEIQPTIDTTQRYLRVPFKPENPSEPANLSAPANTLFAADTIADQLNNEIGRQIAERLGSTASNRDVAAAVLTEFKEKGLYGAIFEMPGVIKIAREKLPPEQFEKMLKLLEDLKENGRSLGAERQREQERERQRRELRDMKR